MRERAGEPGVAVLVGRALWRDEILHTFTRHQDRERCKISDGQVPCSALMVLRGQQAGEGASGGCEQRGGRTLLPPPGRAAARAGQGKSSSSRAQGVGRLQVASGIMGGAGEGGGHSSERLMGWEAAASLAQPAEAAASLTGRPLARLPVAGRWAAVPLACGQGAVPLAAGRAAAAMAAGWAAAAHAGRRAAVPLAAGWAAAAVAGGRATAALPLLTAAARPAVLRVAVLAAASSSRRCCC